MPGPLNCSSAFLPQTFPSKPAGVGEDKGRARLNPKQQIQEEDEDEDDDEEAYLVAIAAVVVRFAMAAAVARSAMAAAGSGRAREEVAGGGGGGRREKLGCGHWLTGRGRRRGESTSERESVTGSCSPSAAGEREVERESARASWVSGVPAECVGGLIKNRPSVMKSLPNSNQADCTDPK